MTGDGSTQPLGTAGTSVAPIQLLTSVSTPAAPSVSLAPQQIKPGNPTNSANVDSSEESDDELMRLIDQMALRLVMVVTSVFG